MNNNYKSEADSNGNNYIENSSINGNLDNGIISRFKNNWSYRQINNFATLSVIAYFIKFLIDLNMYVFMVYDPYGTYYNYDWYLFPPHIISIILMVIYYTMFFKKIFLGWLFKISSIVIVAVNIIFNIVL